MASSISRSLSLRRLAATALHPRPSASLPVLQRSSYATLSSGTQKHKVVIVGGGTAGVTAAAQLRRSSEAAKLFGSKDDIAIIEPAEQHHYQVRVRAASTVLYSTSTTVDATDRPNERPTTASWILDMHADSQQPNLPPPLPSTTAWMDSRGDRAQAS